MNAVTHRKRAEDLGNLKKVSRVETCLGRRRLTFACSRRPWAGVAWDSGGVDEKARIQRLCLSLLMWKKPLNSKVIKSFVHEQRSRKCFFVFRDSYVLCYIYMNIICPFRISVSWVWYIMNTNELFRFFFLYCCVPQFWMILTSKHVNINIFWLNAASWNLFTNWFLVHSAFSFHGIENNFNHAVFF